MSTSLLYLADEQRLIVVPGPESLPCDLQRSELKAGHLLRASCMNISYEPQEQQAARLAAQRMARPVLVSHRSAGTKADCNIPLPEHA